MTDPVVALVLEPVTPEFKLPPLVWLLARLLGMELTAPDVEVAPLALLELVAPLPGKLLLALLAMALDVVAPVLLTVGEELVAVVLLVPVFPSVDEVSEQLYCFSI